MAAVHEVIEYVVRSAVAAHQEHVVVGDEDVRDVSSCAKASENGKRDTDVFSFHAQQAGYRDIESGKTRDCVGDSRDDIVESEHGICGVVLAGAVGPQKGDKKAENKREVERGLLKTAFSERRQRKREQRNTAQKQRQHYKDMRKAVCAPAD